MIIAGSRDRIRSSANALSHVFCGVVTWHFCQSVVGQEPQLNLLTSHDEEREKQTHGDVTSKSHVITEKRTPYDNDVTGSGHVMTEMAGLDGSAVVGTNNLPC